MTRATVAAVAVAFLLLPQMLPGQAPSGGAQKPDTPPQATANPAATQPHTRTPRENEELRADVLMARKQYAEAISVYQKLLQQEPRHAILLNKVGIAYHQLQKLDEAKRYYQRAVKADRTYASAVNNIGTIHYQRKNYRKAIQFYKKALELGPDVAAIHSNLGYACFERKQYDLALESFHRAIELDPAVFERSQHAGSLLQDRSVSERGLFYFLVAKTFAKLGNAEHCALYLRKARDEGYKGMAAAQTDPAFAGVLKDPSVQDVLQKTSPPGDPIRQAPPGPPGS